MLVPDGELDLLDAAELTDDEALLVALLVAEELFALLATEDAADEIAELLDALVAAGSYEQTAVLPKELLGNKEVLHVKLPVRTV